MSVWGSCSPDPYSVLMYSVHAHPIRTSCFSFDVCEQFLCSESLKRTLCRIDVLINTHSHKSLMNSLNRSLIRVLKMLIFVTFIAAVLLFFLTILDENSFPILFQQSEHSKDATNSAISS